MSSTANALAQIGAVTRLGLQTIPQRLGASAAATFGIAGVVAVLVGVLSIAQGVLATARRTGDVDTAIVLRSGANTEMMSGMSGEDARVITEAPGVARGADGPLASPELYVVIDLPKRSTGTDANVPLRGVVPAAVDLRDGFRIVEGRMFSWGLNEVIAGVGAAREFAGLEVGQTLEVAGDPWAVVGRFAAGGSLYESEVWADAAVVQDSYRRGNTYQSVYARLESPQRFTEFKDALTTDPRLAVKVLRTDEYFSEQSATLHFVITVLGTIIAALMGLGALFGALNTMYSAVSARTREIATLRALGFRGGPIVVSVLAEALLLSLAGGALGGGLAYLAFDGFRAATLNFSSFSQFTFAFAVTPALLVQGIVWASVIGLLGGLFPAVRAARLPVATALREQ